MSRRCRRPLFLASVLCLWSTLWPAPGQAQNADQERNFDIGIIIDNRPLPRTEAARADVDALITMIDRQMFIENVMVFERPDIEVICDVFGCPETIEPVNRFPPLLWQITREGKARLFVYYIGEGRTEGVERQLLFPRREGAADGDVVGLSVDWLHAMLKDTSPDFAALMLDTAFAPKPLPCASEDPGLIDDELFDIRRNYLRISRDRWNRTDNIELSATTPVQPPHCDRFDQVLEGIDQPMFTKFVLKGVVDGDADEEPFGDEDGLIELGELAGYLDDRISRAARFQWGRLQNVRTIGSRSRALASIDPRDLRPATVDLLDRRDRTPAVPRGTRLDQRKPDQQENEQDGDPLVRPEDAAPSCGEDTTADDCHPCVLEPGGAACTQHCQEEEGSDFCARFLTTSTEHGADIADSGEGAAGRVEVVPLDEGDDERSAVCDVVAERIAPYAAALVQRIQGDLQPSCGWAEDRSNVERGPIAQIFTPIGWRLGRERTQDMVHCLLDCEHVATAAESETTLVPGPMLPIEETPPARMQVDPRTLGAFNRQICDRLHEPQPHYIGIPRWMPGTLLVSETLRAAYGCPPPAAEPVLPMPLAVTIAPPPPSATPEREMPEDGAPAVADADDRLSTWPPSKADIDMPSGDGETPPPAIEPEAAPEIADATPLENESVPEAADVPPPAPPAEPPFVASESKVHWLQSALTVDNHNPGPIDGAMGPRTIAAIQSWRQDNDRGDRTGQLTEPEFQAIIEAFGNRFDQVQARVGAI